MHRTWKYSILEVHDIDWEEPEVGSTGTVGKVHLSKLFLMENRKKDPKHIMNMVLLDEVNVDVMPDEKFIIYHMKAYMDHREPRLLLENKRLLSNFVCSQTNSVAIALCRRR